MARTVAFATALLSLLALSPSTSTTPTYEGLDGVLWVQHSVEYRANAIETYRAAKEALSTALNDHNWTAAVEQQDKRGYENLRPAVVLDLDETVLNNSVFQAHLIASGAGYSDSKWDGWMDEEKATLVPGAGDFLHSLVAENVTPIYITNRACRPHQENDPTVELLRRLNLLTPGLKIKDQLYCAQDAELDKSDRRKQVAKKFRILLLIGDQLGDFVSIPYQGLSEQCREDVKTSDKLKEQEQLFSRYENRWGKYWFVLPNPMYGSWTDIVGKKLPDKLYTLVR